MPRVVLVLASLLLMVGGWLLQQARPPLPPVAVPPSPAAASGNPPGSRIELSSAAPLSSAEEAETVARWWMEQDPSLVQEAQALLSDSSGPAGWTALHAVAAPDGSRIVLFTGPQGPVGHCSFAADERLSACGRTPPPSVAGTRPAGSPAVLAAHLVRLRDARPGVMFAEAFEPGSGTWERSGDGWERTTRTRSPASGGSGTVLRLDARGALLEQGMYAWRSCACGVAQPRRATVTVAPDEPEPPLPVASN